MNGLGSLRLLADNIMSRFLDSIRRSSFVKQVLALVSAAILLGIRNVTIVAKDTYFAVDNRGSLQICLILVTGVVYNCMFVTCTYARRRCFA